MKRIIITHRPLFLATIAFIGYTTLFDRLPLLKAGVVTGIMCLGLFTLALGNIFLFRFPRRVIHYKHFTIINARVLNVVGIICIMMLSIHLESTNPFNHFPSEREIQLLLVYASALFYYCSLIRIRYINQQVKYL